MVKVEGFFYEFFGFFKYFLGKFIVEKLGLFLEFGFELGVGKLNLLNSFKKDEYIK